LAAADTAPIARKVPTNPDPNDLLIFSESPPSKDSAASEEVVDLTISDCLDSFVF
jgi:hypothetical protein